MITLNISGIDSFQRALQNLESKQIPYAMMLAVNNTAFACRKTSEDILRSSFDRPTPLITKATRVEKATKETLTAKVFVDYKRRVVLSIHQTGGVRGQKGFERKIGLPADWRAVPTKHMPLNQYGNPDKTTNKQIILAKGGKAKGIYFIMPGSKSKQSPGIYKLISKIKIEKLYHFVRKAQYESIMPWAIKVEEEAIKRFPIEASKAIQRAIETAI